MLGGSNKVLSPGKECPSGELFLGWAAGGMVFFSTYTTGTLAADSSFYTAGGAVVTLE